MSSALDRLKNLTTNITSYERTRKENLEDLEILFYMLELDQKVTDFSDLFEFKAINLSAISLANENFGEVKEGKYAQLIAIKYDKEAKVKSKNISLRYFGRAEKVEEELKSQILAFVIRWRFEKSFMTLEHYNGVLRKLKT
ncbi:MAG: hypothetical protein GQ570_06265 [Helicobacteraceae bacterium]|nr:hypothetical protein [Helicobacteraceae bacterium]